MYKFLRLLQKYKRRAEVPFGAPFSHFYTPFGAHSCATFPSKGTASFFLGAPFEGELSRVFA